MLVGFGLAFCLLCSSRIVRFALPWIEGYSLSYLRLYMDDERTRVSLTSRSSESVPVDFHTVRLPRASFFGNHSPAQVHRRASALLRACGLAAPRDVLDFSSLQSLLPPGSGDSLVRIAHLLSVPPTLGTSPLPPGSGASPVRTAHLLGVPPTSGTPPLPRAPEMRNRIFSEYHSVGRLVMGAQERVSGGRWC